LRGDTDFEVLRFLTEWDQIRFIWVEDLPLTYSVFVFDLHLDNGVFQTRHLDHAFYVGLFYDEFLDTFIYKQNWFFNNEHSDWCGNLRRQLLRFGLHRNDHYTADFRSSTDFATCDIRPTSDQFFVPFQI